MMMDYDDGDGDDDDDGYLPPDGWIRLPCDQLRHAVIHLLGRTHPTPDHGS